MERNRGYGPTLGPKLSKIGPQDKCTKGGPAKDAFVHLFLGGFSGIQTAMLRILSLQETCSNEDMPVILARKAVVTLGPDNCGSIVPQLDWFDKLNSTFHGSSSYIKMCWLKAIGGAWTTTCRMHEDIIWPCIFGCQDCKDEILHYLQCPILWQLAREALHISEDHFSLGHRLCFIDCSLDRLKLLAYCHTLYHAIRNDSHCSDDNGNIKSSRFIQNYSSMLSRSLRTLIA